MPVSTNLAVALPVCFFSILAVAGWEEASRAVAQPGPALDLQLYAGLSITGEVGNVYQVQCVTNLAQANESSAWRCLEFLQLPANPYLWIDKSAAANGRRFYQVASFAAPSNLVFIPPGTFRMGSPTNEVGRSLKEGPQTEVAISRGFWMGKYLVSQADYAAVAGNNPSYFSAGGGFPQDLSRPVDSTSWFEATDYCARLTRQERAAGRIPAGTAYRLPTEAEWEYACRAGTSTRFSYGDDPGYTNLADYAWYYLDSGGMTHPVGQKLPNPWGLFDMHGSLEEWCQDWYGPYLGGIAIDPPGPATGQLRVIRGGYWEDTANYCRSASRDLHEPEAEHFHLGFRVVLACDPP